MKEANKNKNASFIGQSGIKTYENDEILLDYSMNLYGYDTDLVFKIKIFDNDRNLLIDNIQEICSITNKTSSINQICSGSVKIDTKLLLGNEIIVLKAYKTKKSLETDLFIHLKKIEINKPPQANAGKDKTITEGNPLYLVGIATDSDGGVVKYSWSENGIELASTQTFTKNDFTIGTHIITLSVTDNDGAMASDTMVVTVNATINYSWKTSNWTECSGMCGTENATQMRTVSCVSSKGTTVNDTMCTETKPNLTKSCTASLCPVNNPPTADAGKNQDVNTGNRVILSASGSSDSDGDTLQYKWSFIEKPTGSSATLTSATKKTPSFVADKAGTYTLKLIVNDGIVDSSDTVTIRVKDVVLLPKVTNLFPTTATQNIATTFTITGENLPDTIAMSLQDSATNSCTIESKTSTKVIMNCVPALQGTKSIYIATKTGGTAINSDVDLTVYIKANTLVPTPADFTNSCYHSPTNSFDQDGDDWYECTRYAFGRSCETTGELLTYTIDKNRHGGKWYEIVNAEYQRGSEPRANSLAVWKFGEYGHVAFVESVNGDNVTISEANWAATPDGKYNGQRTLTKTQMQTRGLNSQYILAGYIYLTKPTPINTIPKNIIIIQQEKNVLIRWDKVTNASTYNVYFSTDGIKYISATENANIDNTKTEFIFDYKNFSGYFKVQADNGTLSEAVAFTWKSQTVLTLSELLEGKTTYDVECGKLYESKLENGYIVTLKEDGTTKKLIYRIDKNKIYITENSKEKIMELVSYNSNSVTLQTDYGHVFTLYYNKTDALNNSQDNECSNNNAKAQFTFDNANIQTSTVAMLNMNNASPQNLQVNIDNGNSIQVTTYYKSKSTFDSAFKNNKLTLSDNQLFLNQEKGFSITFTKNSDGTYNIDTSGSFTYNGKEVTYFTAKDIPFDDHHGYGEETITLNHQNSLIKGKIDDIGNYTNAKYIRIIPRVDTESNNEEGLMCKLDSNYNFGNDCVLTEGAHIENFQNDQEYQFTIYPQITYDWRGREEDYITRKLLQLINIKNISMNFNNKPIANPQSITVSQDMQVNITLSGYDNDRNNLTFKKSNPKYGILSGIIPNLIYTPDKGFIGNDYFSFLVNNGIENSSFATINITVTATIVTASSSIKKTGQTKSYDKDGNEVTDGSLKDDGYYQKGQTPRYTRASDIVTDEITGLMWQDDTEAKTMMKQWLSDTNDHSCSLNNNSSSCYNTSGDTAISYCSNLTLGGYTNWRLPTSIELESIVNYAKYNPAMDTTYFKNVSSDSYLSSTSHESRKDQIWIVNFKYGNLESFDKGYVNYIRCVRVE